MLVLIAKITVKPGMEAQFEHIMHDAIPKVRAEPGNHAYIFHKVPENPRGYMFYEQYDDQAALETHRAHLREMGIDLLSFLDGGIGREFYELIE